jgi:ATP-binding cassette subfamily C (CFTR/MRP) protein 4
MCSSSSKDKPAFASTTSTPAPPTPVENAPMKTLYHTTASNPAPERPENPLLNASLFSKLCFMWPYPILKLGLERPLEDRDLADCIETDTSDYNRDYFNRIWREEQGRNPKNPSLHRTLLNDFLRTTWFVQPLMMLAATAKVLQAVALGLLIESFEKETEDGYYWATAIVVSGIVILFEHHHVFLATWRKGMRLRISCVAAIYDKSLRLSSTHQDTSASYGRIMNLASNDVERFLLASLFINYLWWAPIQSMAILVVGIVLLGPAFAAGFGLLICVFVPLQFYLSGKFAFYRSKIAGITDKRVTFVSQAVRGARVMKMSGYEHRFLERIQDFRREETAQIAKANRLKSYNEALFFSTNVVISLVIFVVHVFSGGVLRPGDVFTVFTLINILQLEMTKHVSLGVMGASECYVSIGRIQKFLEFPELPSMASKHESNTSKNLSKPVLGHNNVQIKAQIEREPHYVSISMDGVKCYWNEVIGNQNVDASDSETDEDSSPTLFTALENITVDFHFGEVTAVIGTVGSGKSALLQALVDELPISAGTFSKHFSTLSYAAQDPWIMDGTVKENITMGREVDESWYTEVVNACGLAMDFRQFRDGDQTIVGDRGVQCRGGQRARIGLARAIYRDADVLVADDPLSAVDAKVGRQLFQEAIMELAVGRGKCVILATHQHQYVHECRCVLMIAGQVECIGTYEECVTASDGRLTAHAADNASVDTLEDPVTEKDALKIDTSDGVEEVDLDPTSIGDDDNKEMNSQGLVRTETYLNYLRAMGGVWIGCLLFVLFSMTQTSVLITIASVGRWAERSDSEQSDWDIIGLCIGLGCSVVLFAVVRSLITFRLTIKASQQLHDRMAQSVLRAKVEFFDTNPLGRILNRFSADVGSNDDLLPATLFDFFMIAFIVLGALITTVVTLPFALAAFPFLLIYFYNVRKVFVTSSRELKRLEGLARSPIFAKLSESLGGIATIRANDALVFFQKKFQDAHDAHTRAFFGFMAASRWVGFRMDSIMFLFLAIVSFLSVLFQTKGWFDVDPSILGLSLSMLLQLAGVFQWCIRQSAEVVNQMVSVERVVAFGNIEPEAPLEIEDENIALKDGWPSAGEIEFEQLSIRYRSSLPLALEQVSFKIPAGARVGIVGRTGSGKSTVVQTLFRLLEAEHGRILIDGVDIASLGLHALRTKISVIPQSPTLFSGCSVRENLDLFNLHDDEALRKVLDDCHLTDVIRDLPQGWNSLVAEGGSNFSVGQRQLLCLARAILSKSRILVLDEATASVDRRTDQLLQEALHESFHGGTILAVAHRLDTVIEHDLILVLGQGRVLEFGTPADLLRGNGAFASMVSDTGDSMSRDLRQRAFAKENS